LGEEKLLSQIYPLGGFWRGDVFKSNLPSRRI